MIDYFVLTLSLPAISRISGSGELFIYTNNNRGATVRAFRFFKSFLIQAKKLKDLLFWLLRLFLKMSE